MNAPVVAPDPHGATPELRGCVVHTEPNRKQRRLRERLSRRTYDGGKPSAKAVALHRARGAAARAYEFREDRRLQRMQDGLCPWCARGAHQGECAQ